MTDDDEFIDYLAGFLTAERLKKFEFVLQHRTRHITVVLEDLYKHHNASAVLRTCDAFGVQDVHLVESRNEFKSNAEVTMGSDRWLTLTSYQGGAAMANCIETLHARGYRVAATVLDPTATSIDDISVEQPLALLFGNERQGLSPTALALADEHVSIPMYGFVDSFNISVAAALALNILTKQMRSLPRIARCKGQANQHCLLPDWQLSPVEQESLRRKWIYQSANNPAALRRRFEQERGE